MLLYGAQADTLYNIPVSPLNPWWETQPLEKQGDPSFWGMWSNAGSGLEMENQCARILLHKAAAAKMESYPESEAKETVPHK